MNDGARDTLTTWSDESVRDRRNVRWAFVVALVLHALFFRLPLPEIDAAEPVRPERPLHVLETHRFEPPPPREQERLPEPRRPRVPVPDPTPDDPEPLEVETRVQTVDLGSSDLVLGVPETPPPPAPSRPIPVAGDVVPPVKIHAPPPRYTEIARKVRIEGIVLFEAIIDTEGRVRDIRLIKGLPFGLTESTMEAVRGWRFEPATLNRKPVAVIYKLQIHFKLT